MPILETQALTRRFGDLTAVNELSIAVEAGEVFGCSAEWCRQEHGDQNADDAAAPISGDA